MIPEHGSEEASSFWKHLVDNRRYVQENLQGIHERESRRFLSQHPSHVYQDGERVGYQNHKKNSTKNKLHPPWKGPGEMVGRVGTNQYLVATDKGEMFLDTMQILPYMPSSLTEQARLHYDTDEEFLFETDRYIVEHIRDHRKTGRGKNQRLELGVKYPGCLEYEWHPASSFMNNVTKLCLKYNKKHNVPFFIRQLSGSQLNWIWREKECYAIVAALLKWHGWVDNKQVEVRTDHRSLEIWALEELQTQGGSLSAPSVLA